jgi:hypothetical protein
MPLRFLFILTGFLFYASAALAQAFEPGLLVRSTGDTLRGEVENSFWVEPPLYIRYRLAAGSPIQQFQPRQLRVVQFAGGRYFRYEQLPFDHAAENRIDRLPRGNFHAIHPDTLLAEVLVEGPALLLRAKSGSVTHYWLRRQGRPDLELSNRRYLQQTTAGTWAAVDGNNYSSQLLVYFGDCPAAAHAAQKSTFTAASLAAVVQTYNEQCGPTHQAGRSFLAQAKPRQRVAFQGGVLAGVRYNRTENDRTDLYSKECADCQSHPFGGLYAELFLPGRHAAIYGELSMSSFQGRSSRLANQTVEISYANGVPLAHYTFEYDDYRFRALLGTARLGARYFIQRPRERQWMLGFSYELNKVYRPVLSHKATIVSKTYTGSGSGNEELYYYFATPTLFPNLAVGWRSQRFTVSVDGQMYVSSHGDDGLFKMLFDSNGALRASLSYRLGRNPDAATAGQPTQHR